MSKWRKKPVVIEAFRWEGPEQADYPDWMLQAISDHLVTFGGQQTDRGPWMSIKTLEGPHLAHIGDYIIQGVKFELYPCKADIFAMTYDPAHDN